MLEYTIAWLNLHKIFAKKPKNVEIGIWFTPAVQVSLKHLLFAA